jgi:hypothetical protein
MKRFFYVAMASVMLITVFAGFAPSYYLRGVFQPDRKLSILLHLHGFVFSAWIVLFLVEAILIVRGSRSLHRFLGWVGTGMAGSMILLASAAAIVEIRQNSPDGPPPAFTLSLNLFNITVFALLVTSAVSLRSRPAWHKRLMLSATLSLLGAAVVRFVSPFLANIPSQSVLVITFTLNDLFFVPCFIFDLQTRRKIHPAYLCGLILLVLSQIATPVAVSWGPWVALAQFIQRW